ncbi:MAG: ThiF family adenylyltransferase, partial [Thermomicrobiales bacterium]
MPTTYRDLLEKTRSEITNITNEQAERLRREGVPFIDVRELDEVEQGIIKGANYIPRSYLESRIENVAPDKHAPLVVYCAGGARSAFAIKALEELGYTNALNLDGGFNSWKISNLPWHVPKSFTPEQRRRYSRHFLLPEVGEEGQRKLLDTKVLMIGAGGLGSPAALYLAAAGIGTIGIVDDDLVDDSNMQRQVAHTTDRIGMPKVESAKIAIQAINPDVHVDTYQFRLSKENVLDLFADYDIIYDGTDNFASRYLINDACVLLDKPNIHGSVFRFEGQATVFHPPAGPC